MKTKTSQNPIRKKSILLIKVSNPVKILMAFSMLIVLSASLSFGQCTNCGSNYPSGTYSPGDSWGSAATNNWAGEYYYLSLNTNYIYQFYTSTSYDTQLTLYPSGTCGGGAYDLAYNDDGGSGTLSWINYSPGTTSARILISQYNCNSNSTNTTVNYRRIAKTPTLSGTTNICRGSSTTLSANIGASNDGYVDVQWGTYCGGTNISSDASSVTVSPTTTTTYYCRPRAKNADGGDYVYGNCASITVVVDQPSNAGTMSVTNSNFCVGGNTTFQASGTVGYQSLEYQWNGTGGAWTDWVNNNPYTWSTTTVGTLYVRSRAKNGVCATVYSSPVSATVVADPVAPTITRSPNTSPVCEGTSLDINASGGSGGTGTVQNQYRYYNGSWSSWTTSAPAFSAVYGHTNQYQSRRYASGSGCGYSSTNTVSWSVDDQPTAPTGITNGGSTICNGESITLTATGGSTGSGCTYQWYAGGCGSGSSLGSGSSISVSPSSNTQYYVRRVGNSSCNNTTSCTSAWVYVDNPPTGGSLTANYAETCDGGVIQFTASGYSGTFECMQYKWNSGGSVHDNWTTNNPHNWTSGNAGNTLYVRSKISRGVCSDAYSSWETVDVHSDPTQPTITRDPNTSPVCEGTSLDVTLSSSGSGGCGTTDIEYQYYNGSWSSWSSSAPSFSAVYGVTNYYRARRTATGYGCDDSSYDQVSWSVDDQPTAPTGITNGGSTICNGENITLTATGGSTGSGSTYQWYAGGCGSGASLGSGSSISVSPSSNTQYYVRRVGNSSCSNTTSCTSTWIYVDPLPTASAGGSQDICVNETATVSGASAANGTIAWTENGAGSITSGATTLTPTYTPAAGDAGNAVTLTMTVSSNNNCSGETATATYTVNVDPLPTASAGGSQDICINETATVSGASASNGTIAWTENGAGTITSGATTLTPTYTPAAGDVGNAVTLTMTVSSNNDCSGETATATYTVNVDPLPTASAGGSQDICVNETATVSGASAANGTIAWTENGAGSITSGATTLTPTYTPAAGDAGNTVILTMTVSSNNGCSGETAIATYTVNVDPLPTASAGGSQDICVIETATVSGASASNGTIAWTENGAGSITSGSTTLTPTYTPAAGDIGNTITLTMTVSSNNNCSGETAIDTYTVIVHPNFSPGTINNTGETICSGGDPAAIGSSTPASGGDGAITYKWQANGSDIASSNSATYDPPAGLTANTTYTRWAHDGACNTSWEESTNSWTVTVETPPAPAGLDAGDYYWAGEISNSWNNANNWLLYDGSNYSVPASIPNATSDVFIKSYASTCGTTNALTDASSTVHAKDVNIETVLTIGNSAQLNITGDFNNAGTFNAGTGSIVLNGTSQQNIQPGGDDFYNLTINNTSGLFDAIVLDDNINIAGHLQLSQGIIDGTIAPYKVKLLNGATANSGNANSFVNGEVERTGTTAFVYPIGDVANIDGTDRGIWAPIETDACASSTISANYYYENPPYDWWYHGGNMDATIDHVSDREYWDLVTDNATPAVTIYWTDNTDDLHSFGSTSGEMTSTFLANNMTIAHYNTALGKWDDMGATIPAGPIYFDDGSIKTTSAFSSYSPITFASKNPDFTLPVELINFSANCMDEYVEINWTSATEINNEYYLIERSKDGISWETIAKVPGAGNSNTTIDYQVIDEKFNTGINYYRLIQFDFDGSSETFEIRTVNCDNDKMEPEITIYPNPFTNELNLMASNWNDNGKVIINFTDMTGRVLQSYNAHVENSSFHLLMRLNNLTPGMYIVEIQSENHMEYFKVQKK